MNNAEGVVTVEGFASYADAKTEDLVPWTPLRAGKALVAVPTILFKPVHPV